MGRATQQRTVKMSDMDDDVYDEEEDYDLVSNGQSLSVLCKIIPDICACVCVCGSVCWDSVDLHVKEAVPSLCGFPSHAE